MKKTYLLLTLFLLNTSVACSQKENYPPIEDFNKDSFSLEKIIDDIEIPWGLSFTGIDSFLVTDKKGILYHVSEGKKSIVEGTPDITLSRQGGLLDVAVDLNFDNNNKIFLTASITSSDTGSNTALYSAILSNNKLSDLRLLYKALPDSTEERHFGGSILVTQEFVFFTIGDRGNRDVNPQSVSLDGGKVYRLNLDGSIPDSNPFYNVDSSKKAIWSYGHRNPQGIIKVTRNVGVNDYEIWIHEHGPRGGDEINKILFGKNYGWPITSYGEKYGLGYTKKSYYKKNHAKYGFEEPVYSFVPSIGISEIIKLPNSFSEHFQNNFILSSLYGRHIYRIKFDNTFKKIIYLEDIFVGERIRDLKYDDKLNLIYLAFEENGEIGIISNNL